MKKIKEILHSYSDHYTNTDLLLTEYVNDNDTFSIPKDQQYFGLIVDEVYFLTPDIGTYTKNYEPKDYSGYVLIDDNVISSIDEPIGLIFKVVKESNGKIDYIEEIFSGVRMKVYKETKKEIQKDEFLDFKEFQLRFDEVRNNPLAIIPKSGPFKLDDQFKMLVARSLMGREEEIKTILQDGEAYAKKEFENDLKKCVSDAYEKAYVDNMLLDYEKKLTLTNK